MEPFELELNINDFFTKGFTLSRVRKDLADSLLVEARTQTFIENDGKYKEDPELIAPQTSNWESPFLPKRFANPTPQLVQEIGHQIGTSERLHWFLQNFGNFSQSSFMVNRYRKGGGMVFHNDNFDGTFLSVLIYLTGGEYVPEDGGRLLIGSIPDYECLKDARISDNSALREDIFGVTPTHGTAVIVNNLNPMFVHAVSQMRTEKERYTVLCHYGYFEHTCRTYRKVVG